MQLTRAEALNMRAHRLISVGYYGGHDEHGRQRTTLVHAHITGTGPLCGARIASYMRYHWCSWTARSSSQLYLECKRCQAAVGA
jgi:hypothetical protein